MHLIKLTASQRSRAVAVDASGWMQDLADPHARERALAVASQDPPSGVAPDEAVAEVRDVLASIGDTCIAAGSERRETALVRPSNSPKNGELRIGHTRSGATGISLDLNRCWQLHHDHPPPTRPPSSATARDRAENRGALAPVFADREARSVTWTKPGSPGRTTAKARCAAIAGIPGSGAEWHLHEVRYVRKYKYSDLLGVTLVTHPKRLQRRAKLVPYKLVP
jgi:hypothetical protein